MSGRRVKALVRAFRAKHGRSPEGASHVSNRKKGLARWLTLDETSPSERRPLKRAYQRGTLASLGLALLGVFLALPASADDCAAPLAASIPAAVEKTLANLGQLRLEEDAELKALKRRTYRAELENEVTRVLADLTAVDLLTNSCDVVSTGWAISRGAYEGNPLLGGSKNSALIIVGTKGLAFAGKFLLNRRKATAYVACMLDVYDGAARECNQLRNLKRATIGSGTLNLGLCGHNISQITKLKESAGQ